MILRDQIMINPNISLRGLINGANKIEKGSFAPTRGPSNNDKLSSFDSPLSLISFKRDIFQGNNLFLTF